jgi:iron only hydrogenase large subunit-like protein
MRDYHSVTLDKDKCKGCTNCIKHCPTEAIRVRDGKARILEAKCIDCGECIRRCPYHAKTASTDDISVIKNYKYSVAIPAPSIYGQFKDGTSPAQILSALLKLGFDEIYEVALAAERVTVATRKYLEKPDRKKPGISSSCPAIIRLIQVRFPELIPNIIPIKSPMEIAGRMARAKVIKERGLNYDDIGVFFISPCPAKVTSIKSPVGSAKSSVDGAFSISQVYGEIIKHIKDSIQTGIQTSTGIGIGWARAGGENLALGRENYLSVDGIHNVISVLEEIENGKLSDIDYIECQACIGGCVGGALTVENQFVARVKIKKVADKYPGSLERLMDEVNKQYAEGFYSMDEPITHKPVLKLDNDISIAIRKMDQIKKILADLPGLDCGSCGSPNCRALAEDIVLKTASEVDCIFKLRESLSELAEEMVTLSRKVPPVMESENKTIKDGV